MSAIFIIVKLFGVQEVKISNLREIYHVITKNPNEIFLIAIYDKNME